MQIPKYILDRLSLDPKPKGERHQEKLKLTFMLVGERVPDHDIRLMVKERYPQTSESELTGLIDGAHKRNPQPASTGDGTHLSRYTRKVKSEGEDRPTIKFDAAKVTERDSDLPKCDLTTVEFLQTVFGPDEHICITNEAVQDDGKWRINSKGTFQNQAYWSKRLVDHPEAYNQPYGSWVRINPFLPEHYEGTDEEVSSYKHVLVEFDSGEKLSQWTVIKSCGLPITCVIDSGNKSLHAWVRVDAPTLDEYRVRVKKVYNYLSECGVDQGVGNPSRWSRLPGVMRGDKPQQLVAMFLNAHLDFEQWEDSLYGLPPIEQGTDVQDKIYDIPDEVIEGILAKGCKGILGGPSKARKSWSMIDLAEAASQGQTWLGFQTGIKYCQEKGIRRIEPLKVLYVNFELKPRTMQQRLKAVAETRGIARWKNLDVWNLRGYAADIAVIVDRIVKRIKKCNYDLIILDPAYKCLGNRDENKAGDMTDYLNHIERLSEESGAAIVIAAHFAKGDHHSKEANDRISGSGVFMRDPDAAFMLTPAPGEPGNNPVNFEMDITVREFKPVEKIELTWDFPAFIRKSDEEIQDRQMTKDYERNKRKIDVIELLRIKPEGLTSAEWRKMCQDRLEIDSRSFKNYPGRFYKEGLIKENPEDTERYQPSEAFDEFRRKLHPHIRVNGNEKAEE